MGKHKKHQPPKAETKVVREPATFKLLPTEKVLEDDYLVCPDYVYIADNVFVRYHGWEVRTVAFWKESEGINEVRRCDPFSHPGAHLGDKVIP
jgi:hypothetical protein